jgi:hypothetical protein
MDRWITQWMCWPTTSTTCQGQWHLTQLLVRNGQVVAIYFAR